MIDLEKMAKAHKKLFPNASLESQCWKMEEEILEYEEADFENKIKESADIVIVCGGLYRWCPRTAKAIASIALNNAFYQEIEAEVNRKWQINLNRKWEWNGKTYHHIEKKGEE